jgi:tetratricopeptide (TPR) repeat protein
MNVMNWFKDDPLADDFVREVKATVPWLLAAVLVVAGYYGVKNYRAARKAAASEAFVNAYTAEELEEAVSKFGGTDAGGALKLRLAKKYFDGARYQEALDLYATVSGDKAPDGFADIPEVGKAQCLEALGSFADALAAYESFAEANPDSYLALSARLGSARVLAQLGEKDKALARLAEIKASVKGDAASEARVDATEDCVKRYEAK